MFCFQITSLWVQTRTTVRKNAVLVRIKPPEKVKSRIRDIDIMVGDQKKHLYNPKLCTFFRLSFNLCFLVKYWMVLGVSGLLEKGIQTKQGQKISRGLNWPQVVEICNKQTLLLGVKKIENHRPRPSRMWLNTVKSLLDTIIDPLFFIWCSGWDYISIHTATLEGNCSFLSLPNNIYALTLNDYW